MRELTAMGLACTLAACGSGPGDQAVDSGPGDGAVEASAGDSTTGGGGADDAGGGSSADGSPDGSGGDGGSGAESGSSNGPDGSVDGGACPGAWGGGWAASPVKVDAPIAVSGYDGLRPKVGMDLAGNATVVWEQGDSNALYSVWAARRPAGGAFQPQTQIGASAAPAYLTMHQEAPPALAVSDDGSAMAVWRAPSSPPELHASHYTAALGWSGEQRIDQAPTDAGVGFMAQLGDVAADGSGSFFVVWLEQPPTAVTTAPDYGGQVYARRFDVHSGWGSPVRLSSNGHSMPGTTQVTTSAAHPVLVMNATGSAVVAWTAQGNAMTGAAHGVEAARYEPASGTWGAEAFVDACSSCTVPASSNSAPVVRAALNAAGLAMVAFNLWPDAGGTQNVWVSTSTSSGPWSAPVPVDTGSGDGFPHVALDGTGAASVTWVESLDLQATSSTAGGGWPDGGALIASGPANEATDINGIALYADPPGGALLFWSTGTNIDLSQRMPGSPAWAPFVTLATGATAYEPQLAWPRGTCAMPLLVFWGTLNDGRRGVFALDGR